MNIIRKDATIENTDDEFPGSFEVVLSTPAKDRDGDELATEDWKQPLPEHITFDADHGMSVASTVGSGVPSIDDGKLIVRGTYSSLPRAQEVRTLVKEGHIRTTSVAFMAEKEQMKDGKSRTVRELLNGAFVAIPSNREAVVLATKAGARHSAADMAHIQAIADHARALGAAVPMDDTQAEEGAVSGKAAKPDFTPLADGTHVTWHYRGAIGHGTIVGVHKLGTDHDTTEYSIEEHDHHVSESGSREKPVVYHFGSALTVVSDDEKSYRAELKAKYTAEQSRQMLADGHAIVNENGDPSYEIGDLADLRRAIRAVGRGSGDHDKIRAYIIRRAKDLDASDEIPEDWNADGSVTAEKRFTRMVAAKAVDGSYEQREQAICDALAARYPGDDVWAYSLATFDDSVIYRVSGSSSDLLRGQWQAPYTYTDGIVTLGDPQRVDLIEQVVPMKSFIVKEFVDADATVTPPRLAQAVDASLDDCLLIINQLDRSSLPPQVQQLCDTVTAAAECVDQLLDALGVDDPDDLDDEGAAAGDAATGAAGRQAATGDAAKSVDTEALDMQYRALSLQLAAYTTD